MFSYRAENPDNPSLEESGNKHKNNIKQYKLRKALDLQGVSIPKPKRVFFLKGYDNEIKKMWRELSELYEKSETKNTFFEDANVKKLFAEIDTIIDKAFSQALENKDLFNTLDPSKKLSNWFDQMSANGNFLMVRSTGSEDTRKMANAGGNVSEHYVKPEREEFCNASRKVVESYFNQRSLQNQINLGINPFAEELKLAVSV